MSRVSPAAVICGVLMLTLGAHVPLAIAADESPSKPVAAAVSGPELIAANPQGASSAILLVNYQSAAGRNLDGRLNAFARANPGLKIVVRPVGGGGPLAEFLAKAAYAAARQGKFAAFHDHALSSPIAHTWYSLRDNAPVIGLDWQQFQLAYADPALAEAVKANMGFVEEHKVTAFPAFVAGGRVFAGTWDSLDFAAIAAAAKAGGPSTPAGAR